MSIKEQLLANIEEKPKLEWPVHDDEQLLPHTRS